MKRRLLIVAVFLLAGAVVNVAVAWGCATWSALKLVSSYEATDADQRWWQRQVLPAGVAPEALAVWRSCGFGFDSMLILGVRSGKAVFRVDSSGRTTFNAYFNAKMDRATTMRSGWPWRSGAGERWDLGTTMTFPMLGYEVTTWRVADVHTSAVSFDRPGWLGGSSFRILPLRPIWSGFVVNTLLYAAVLGLLIGGPFALRRFIRVKRGLCPACAYPRGESDVCSECGKALPGRAKAVT